jgi:flagellar biosynthesis component FlhA
MLLTVITSVNKVLPTVTITTVGRTLLTEVITVRNILYHLAAVISYSNSRKNFIDRGYHS